MDTETCLHTEAWTPRHACTPSNGHRAMHTHRADTETCTHRGMDTEMHTHTLRHGHRDMLTHRDMLAHRGMDTETCMPPSNGHRAMHTHRGTDTETCTHTEACVETDASTPRYAATLLHRYHHMHAVRDMCAHGCIHMQKCITRKTCRHAPSRLCTIGSRYISPCANPSTRAYTHDSDYRTHRNGATNHVHQECTQIKK